MYALALLLGAHAATPAPLAGVIIPATGFVGLAGDIDAACTDLIVTGTLNLDSDAFVRLRDVIVEPGGLLAALAMCCGGRGAPLRRKSTTKGAGP
jgi:hypothetical protein